MLCGVNWSSDRRALANKDGCWLMPRQSYSLLSNSLIVFMPGHQEGKGTEELVLQTWMHQPTWLASPLIQAF